MDATEYLKLKTRVERIIHRYGYFGLNVEDVTQNILLRRLENPEARRPLFYFIVDEMRKEYGDRRNKTTKVDRHVREIDQIKSLKTSWARLPAPDMKATLPEYVNMRDRDSRIVFVLKHAWGMTYAEIGFIIGVTESTVAQYAKEIKERIREYEQRAD